MGRKYLDFIDIVKEHVNYKKISDASIYYNGMGYYSSYALYSMPENGFKLGDNLDPSALWFARIHLDIISRGQNYNLSFQFYDLILEELKEINRYVARKHKTYAERLNYEYY